MATSLEPDKKYLIGVVGDVTALLPFWEIMRDRASTRALSDVGLTAVALTGGEINATGLLADMGVPVYANHQEMLGAHPEINLIIDATSQPAMLTRLRHELPTSVILLERAAASFFLRMLAEDQMALACRIDRHNTLNMLTTIVDQLADQILFLDPQGIIVHCNNAAAKSRDLTKREVVGRHLYDLYPKSSFLDQAHRPGNPSPFEQTLDSLAGAEGMASEVGPDGLVRYFRIQTHPILDMDKLSHVVFFRRDITERTQLEHRLHQTEKLASVGELSTYIAHEIRNPLFAIAGFANSLLRTAEMDEPSREKLGIILAESKRLDTILKSLLNFARPMEAKESMVDLNAVAEATMQVMGIASEEQGVRITLDLNPRIAKAEADPDLITQCLINLVKNSMEALADQEGGGELNVRTFTRKGHPCLEVEDTGPGIPVKIRGQIFSPFFSTKGKGAGLGLAMVRKIMDEIGGEVDLVSSPGKGARITLVLPPALAVAKSQASA